MRVIAFGSRDWCDVEAVYDRLVQLPPGTILVHGNARGADTIAGRIGDALDLVVEAHPAQWTPTPETPKECIRYRNGRAYDVRAGHMRNDEMVALGADLALAFWDGGSPGTAGMIEKVRAAGIPLEVITC